MNPFGRALDPRSLPDCVIQAGIRGEATEKNRQCRFFSFLQVAMGF
jgi:hypothetical protein